MARLSRTGASRASLYELDTNFEQVLSDLGLASMPADAKQEIRGKLEEVMGRGYDEFEMSEKLNPHSKLRIKNLTASLATMARLLQEAEQNLRGSETGLGQAHHIEMSLKVREMLAFNPEIGSEADEFLRDFCNRLSAVAHACSVAAKDLRATKGKAGRRALNWYNDFTRVLMSIAKQSGIRPTITIDRDTGKAEGRFLKVAASFERLFPPEIRSPSSTARAKRLSRALAALKKWPAVKSPKNKQGQNRHRGG